MDLVCESSGALKPCPFCGGEAEYHSHVSGQGINTGKVVCMKCKASIHDSLYGPGVDEPCERWNTREERTCMMRKVLLYDEEQVEGIECSECEWSEVHNHGDPLSEYCPNCGAKVVEK